MSADQTIKPCPFCGSAAELGTYFKETPKEYKVVECSNGECGLYISTFTLEEWNKRSE